MDNAKMSHSVSVYVCECFGQEGWVGGIPGGLTKRCHSTKKNQHRPFWKTNTTNNKNNNTQLSRSSVLTCCSLFLCGKCNFLPAAGVISKFVGNGSI